MIMPKVEVDTPFYKIITYESTDKLISKGFSRCFVTDPSHIPIVESIIKSMDEDEYEMYYRDERDWITTFNPGGDNKLVYNGKFAVDIKRLTQICLSKGIDILVMARDQPPYVNNEEIII